MTTNKSDITVSTQPAVRLVGLSVRTSMAKASTDCGKIFQQLGPRMHEIATNGGGVSYGVSHMVANCEDAFDYWAALPVDEKAVVPSGMGETRIPAGLYARLAFTSFKDIGLAFQKLYGEWLPSQKEYELRTDAPCYEYYAPDAVQTGLGFVFMPVNKRS